MEDEIKKIIDKYNNIYIAKKAKLYGSVVTSERLHAPIRLNIPDKNDKKANEEFGLDRGLIFSVEFRLNHKTIFWSLKHDYYVDEKYKKQIKKLISLLLMDMTCLLTSMRKSISNFLIQMQ